MWTTKGWCHRHQIVFQAPKGAVLWLPDVCCTCLHFFSFFCCFLATYSMKFYIIGFVSSCCVQRPRKFVTVSCWSVCGCVLLSEAWRHVCRPTRCLLLRRQRSSVVCQLSTVCMRILVHHIHTVDLILLVLRPPGWPCNAGLVSCHRVWSVHCSQPTRTASACHVCIWETVLTSG